MPIEIRELHIRVSVAAGAQGGAGQQAAGGGRGGEGQGSKDELVAECVEQVMEILRARTER